MYIKKVITREKEKAQIRFFLVKKPLFTSKEANLKITLNLKYLIFNPKLIRRGRPPL